MSPTRLSRPGVYLFRPPGLYTSTLDQETLILFSVRFPKVYGAVLYQSDQGTQSVVDLLEALLARMQNEIDIGPSQITAKIFGMRVPELAVMRAIGRWLEGKGIRLGVCDTGKRVQRRVLLDVQNSRVGVTYSPIENPFFLAKGSPRGRAGFVEETLTRVLVITPNRMKQSLAAAALEGMPGWKATVVGSFEGAASKVIEWDIILLADDVTWTDKWAGWLEAVAKNYPKTRFAWSGERLPAQSPVPLQSFPPIHDETIPAFKSALGEAAENPLAWPAAGTLPFRRSTKRQP